MTKPVLKNKVASIHTRKETYVIAGTSQIESKNAGTLNILGHTQGSPVEKLAFLSKCMLLCLLMGEKESARSLCMLPTD